MTDTPTTPPPITLFTDGACLGNPGPGGYAGVLISATSRQEFSGGFARTTNNRMEIMAVIVGLQSIPAPSTVSVFSDSKYVVNAIQQRWVHRWESNHWMRNPKESARNVDLWQQLLPQLERHVVTMRWVKGHADHTENNRCDALATEAARQDQLPDDEGFLTQQTPSAAPRQLDLLNLFDRPGCPTPPPT